MTSPALTVRQRRVFAIVTIVLALAAAAATTLLLDLYAHRRQATHNAINIWGYRGPIVGRKQRDERRIVVIGGSIVFGYAYPWQDAFPAVLERNLRERVPTPVSVVNLGFPMENAYAFRAVFEDYRYLDPDLVVFYGELNTRQTRPEIRRDQSAIFRLTGYYPLLPTAMREKAMVLRHDGDIVAGYANRPTAANASIAQRTGAGLLNVGWIVADKFSRSVAWLGRRPPEPPVSVSTCAEPWRAFCDAMYRAVVAARDRGKPVLVVSQPSFSDLLSDEQRALRAMLETRFGQDRDVHYLDLRHEVDMRDRAMAMDRNHLTPLGNRRVADRLRDVIQPLLWSVPVPPPAPSSP